MLRSIPILLLCVLAGCSTVKSGAYRAERALVRVGDSIEDGAETAGRKTRSFWNRLFGGESSSSSSSRRSSSSGGSSSPSTTASGDSASFDTYTEEQIGD